MFKLAYDEASGDDALLARKGEWRAIEKSIELLEIAAKKGHRSRESIEALLFVRRLWSFFIEDLCQPTNGLPQELRANLISIGLWILNEEENIRLGMSSNYSGIVEISRMIQDGIGC